MYGTQEMCILGFWGDMRERDNLEDIDIKERIILKLVLNKWYGEVLTRLMWPRIGAGGGPL
jgi:hypothetical protein